MLWIQRFALATVSGICLLLALLGGTRFAIEVGAAPLPHLLQDAGIIAAGILGMLLCHRLGRGVRARQEEARQSRRRFDGTHVEASATWLIPGLALAMLGLMAGYSGWGYLFHLRAWPLLAMALFFSTLFLMLAPMILSLHPRGRPTLRMDGQGLDHVWYGHVPWTRVHGLFHREVEMRYSKNHALVLGVSEPGTYLARTPRFVRLMTGQRRTPPGRYGTLVVPLNGLGQDPLRLLNAARTLRARVAPPLLPVWFPGMNEAAMDVSRDLASLGAPAGGQETNLLGRMQELEQRLSSLDPRSAPP